MRSWPARVWTWSTTIVGTRQGTMLVVAAALVVWAVEAVGWPTAPGRDLEAYVAVYADFWATDGVFPWEMLSRTPVAPLVVGGLLDVGSPLIVELAAAFLFAGAVLLHTRTALLFGRGPAVLVAVALLAYPGYGVVFHELASEIVFAAGFAVWTALAVRAALLPSVLRFGVLGVATAGLALTRPSNQAFLVAALLPLALAAPWRLRLARALAFTGVAVALLGAWAATNLWRYDDFAVVRGGQASLPLFRTFTVDRIVRPDNGPASRELAAVVARELLPEEPYRSYGVNLETFFARGSPRLHEDLIVLSDRVYGWDSDYAILGRVARESVRAHPWIFTRNVLRDFWKELSKPLFAGRGAETAEPAAGGAAARGTGLPEPTEGEVVPSEHQSAQNSTPDGSIREVWSSPTEHVIEFDDPARRARWLANDRREAELVAAFPDRWSSAWLGLQLDRSSKLYPPLWAWLVLGCVAVALRRPRAWWATLAPLGGALAMLLVTVLAVYAEPAYAVPVGPAFVLFAAVALLGERDTTRTTRSATSSPFRTTR